MEGGWWEERGELDSKISHAREIGENDSYLISMIQLVADYDQNRTGDLQLYNHTAVLSLKRDFFWWDEDVAYIGSIRLKLEMQS